MSAAADEAKDEKDEEKQEDTRPNHYGNDQPIVWRLLWNNLKK